MSAIGPGDWVECVKYGNNTHHTSGRIGPAAQAPIYVGTLYRVDTLVTWTNGRIGLGLVERPGFYENGRRINYVVECFRPIRSDITSITRLLTEPIDAGMVGA